MAQVLIGRDFIGKPLILMHPHHQAGMGMLGFYPLGMKMRNLLVTTMVIIILSVIFILIEVEVIISDFLDIFHHMAA